MVRRTIILILAFAAAACGAGGDILGGLRNQPDMRVIGWEKVDLYPDIELTQPFILVAGKDEELLEPTLIFRDGRFVCYYERLQHSPSGAAQRSDILAIESEDGLDWRALNGGEPVLSPSLDWEGSFVGAPTVLAYGDELLMYYVGGVGSGIGMARSLDGFEWEKRANPVLSPSQGWEDGLVAAPTAIFMDEIVALWYSGGAGDGNMISWRAGRAIGFASSEDGANFIKSAENPVLSSGEAWEGCDADSESYCRVSSPSVMARETGERRILQMFYTGGEAGESGHADASIGYAASEDGIHWEKADDTLNPVVQEYFALRFPGIDENLTYDESAPSVLYRPDRSWMVFTQFDPLNWLGYKLKGLAIATNPGME